MSAYRPYLRPKPADFAVLVPALAVVLASFAAVYASGSGRATVNVRADGGRWVFPMDSVHVETVSGPLGDTAVEIGPGGARVVSSPCRDQVCVVAGRVSRPGQWAACLPNRVMLYVGGEGGGGGAVDGSDATVR